MLKKKERTHEAGASNIDFRSKGDNDSILFFQPWKNTKHNGTMGQSYLEKPVDDMKNLIKIAKNVLTTKEMNFQTISPKLYSSVKFYSLNNIPIKKRTYLNSDKVAELDEFVIGKQRYLGDSMRSSSIIKIPNMKKTFLTMTKSEVASNRNMDKFERHNNSDLETQLVTIKASHTDQNKINHIKIRDVILALRRRYQNRTNIPKIFKEWDMSNKGIISAEDAHKMINKLGIPINLNETKALITTSSYDNKDFLDLESFIQMIFSQNQNFDKTEEVSKHDLVKNETKNSERKDYDNRISGNEQSKKEEVQYLKEFLKSRFPIMIKQFSLKSDYLKDNLCDLSTFSDVIKSFKISSRYTNPEIISDLFNEYKNSENLVDYIKFIDSIRETKEKNYFFTFQDKYINLLESKAQKTNEELNKYRQENIKLIKAEEELIRTKKEVLDEQISNKANRQNLNSYDDRYIRNSQPSKEFFLKLWANREDHNYKRKEIINSFEPTSLVKELYKGNGRYSSNKHFNKDTSANVSTTEGSGHYISEKEKFDRNILKENYGQKEKNFKNMSTQNRLNNIKEINDFLKERNDVENFLLNQKKMYSLNERSKKLRIYEMKNNMRNNVIE